MTDETAGGPVERYFWSGHASSWSVWTLLLAYPALVIAVYGRRPRLLAAVLLFVALNPVLSPPPADDRAWATRVVLGERRWMDEGPAAAPGAAALVAAGAPVNLFTLWSTVRRRPARTAAGLLASMVLTLGFFDRMVRLYDARVGEGDGAVAGR